MRIPKAPETITDQIFLCLTLTLFGLSAGMLSLALQEKPIPQAIENTAKDLAIGIFAGISVKKLTNL